LFETGENIQENVGGGGGKYAGGMLIEKEENVQGNIVRNRR
jgi:hypothetical protein